MPGTLFLYIGLRENKKMDNPQMIYNLGLSILIINYQLSIVN